MPRFSRLLFGGISLFTVSVVLGSACRARPQAPEYTTTATIKDIMDSIVDPSADVVWNSVSTMVSTAGIEEKAPKNDEEWADVRRGAIRLVEAPNLLMLPGRHVARPGEKSETPGVELEPEEMEARINKDREAWNRRAKALHDVSLEMLHAVEAKDREKVLEVGDRLDKACENCHLNYWYPNQVLPPGYEEH